MRLSIIIPIYNAEKYLNKCLDSIISQIEVNDEVILINDASTDNSSLICQKYKENNEKIILINNEENRGIAYARNLGLKYANGDYILWIDSDDWVNNKYLSIIKNCLRMTNTDILIFDYTEVNNQTYKCRVYKEKSGFISKKDIMLDIAQDSFFSLLWRTVIKKALYENIEFPEKIQLMEDFYVYHKLFYKAQTFFYLKDSLYFYRVLEQSLSHKKEKNFYEMYIISLEREKFIKKYCSDIEEKYRMIPVIVNACSLCGTNYISKEEHTKIRKLIKKNIKFFISKKYIGKKKKLQLLIYMISPNLLSFIRRIMNKG